ncbi:MAG: hypothetical protein RIG82_12545 [Phycisphaeraceae bacterium]
MTRPRFMILTLTLMTLFSSGCQEIGYIAGIFTGWAGLDQIPAVYELEERPTLVLVDDRQGLLGSPATSQQVANVVGNRLIARAEFTESMIIDPRRITKVAEELGPLYAQTPIDAIGRALDAEQVIAVSVISAQPELAPGILQPKAQVLVEVIDVASGRRLFPAGTTSSNVAAGYPISVQLGTQAFQDGRASMRLAANDLARLLGLRIAQLFYDREPDEE